MPRKPWLGVLAAVALYSLAGGCAEKYQAEIPQPSDERIRELMNMPAPTKKPGKPIEFSVRMMPPLVIAGAPSTVVCYVPESYQPGIIRLGLNSHDFSNRPLDQVENRLLIQHVMCGTFVASCAIETARGVEVRTNTIEAFGDCNSGGSK